MTTQQKRFFCTTIIALTLSACGGGGDGAGGGGTAGISYTGITSQASLTVGNGEEVSTMSYQNGGAGQGLGTVLLSQTEVEPAQQNNNPKAATLAKTLIGAISKIQISPDVAANHLAVQSETDSFPGDCGGTASYTISVDDISGDFSGSFTFSNYCELGDVTNGSLSMTGNINLNTFDFGSITMTMTSLSFNTGNESFTMDGTMSLNPDNNPIIVTMNMKLKDNTTEQVFWAQNFLVTIVNSITYEDLSMVGKFYHPDYGYVDITTPTPFRFTESNEYPYPGVMIATGVNNSTTTLTSLSVSSYQIDIDEDGDTAINQTTTGNWSSL